MAATRASSFDRIVGAASSLGAALPFGPYTTTARVRRDACAAFRPTRRYVDRAAGSRRSLRPAARGLAANAGCGLADRRRPEADGARPNPSRFSLA